MLKVTEPVLLADMKWETDYISSVIKAKITPTQSWIKLSNGFEANSWNYDMPKVADKQTAQRQLYVSLVNGSRVFTVNSPVEGGDVEKDLLQKLIGVISTLKPSSTPIDIRKIAKSVKTPVN